MSPDTHLPRARQQRTLIKRRAADLHSLECSGRDPVSQPAVAARPRGAIAQRAPRHDHALSPLPSPLIERHRSGNPYTAPQHLPQRHRLSCYLAPYTMMMGGRPTITYSPAGRYASTVGVFR